MENHTRTITDIIKSVCSKHGLEIKELIFFGSRARGDYHAGSDYDFLALTDKPLSHEKKMDLWLYIARALAEIDVTADILFKSFDEFSRDKGDTGKVTYYACKEGISI